MLISNGIKLFYKNETISVSNYRKQKRLNFYYFLQVRFVLKFTTFRIIKLESIVTLVILLKSEM